MNAITSTLVAIILFAQSAAGATTAFFYKSGPAGSYVAQNTAETIYGGQSGWVFSTPRFQDNVIYISMIKGNYEQTWYMELTPPKDQLLTTGIGTPNIYTANRYPFQDSSMAGFSWDGNGRGCNRLTAYFEILDFSLNLTTHAVNSLAFKAIQFEETGSATGNLNYEKDHCAYLSYSFASDIGVSQSPSAALLSMTVPESTSPTLAGLGACLIIVRRKRA